MRRRSFLGLSAAAAAAPILSACGETREPGQLYGRAVAQAPPGTPWDAQWRNFEANIATNPTIALDYFTKAELGDEERMFHDLRRGRSHVGGMSLQGLASSVPEATIAMAPYLFESREEVDFIYDEYLFDIIDELCRAQNLRLLQWVEVGWTHVFANQPLTHPDMAAGLRMRTSPNAAARYFCEAADMDAIPLGIADVVPALQTGLVQGGLSSAVFHFFSTLELAAHFTLTYHSYDTGAIVLNADWYESATEDQKRTIDGAWGSSAEARAGVRFLDDMVLGWLREGVQRGRDGEIVRPLVTITGEPVQVHELSDEERAAWRSRTENVIDRLVETIGGRSRDVYDRILEGRAAFAEMNTQTEAGS
ncbi:MAG: TRAP transporter substrate-binding protein DctP [Pseudomonadota bacterium]